MGLADVDDTLEVFPVLISISAILMGDLKDNSLQNVEVGRSPGIFGEVQSHEAEVGAAVRWKFGYREKIDPSLSLRHRSFNKS